MTIYEKLKKIFFYKKFLREGVRAWDTIQITPSYQQLAGIPRMSNLNDCQMEYTETDFTDALIEALCGETIEDAEQ